MNIFQRSGSGMDLEPYIFDDMGLTHVQFRHASQQKDAPMRDVPEWARQQGRNGTDYATPPTARQVFARLAFGAAVVAAVLLSVHFYAGA